MKTYTVKNYKGNLVESLKKFQANHKNIRVLEATETEDTLKIKCEEKNPVAEDNGRKCYIVYAVKNDEVIEEISGVFTSKSKAEKFCKYKEQDEDDDEVSWYWKERNLDNAWNEPIESGNEKTQVSEDVKSDFEKKCVYCKDCKYATMTADDETKYCDFFQPDGGESLYLPVGSFCSNGVKK